MILRFCLFVCLFLIPVLPVQAAPYVVGTWYGQGQPDDRHEMWLEHMLPNGGYDGLYRSCADGKATDVFQTGSWSLDKDIITIRVATVNGAFEPRTDLYQTLSEGKSVWTYRYIRLNYVYNARRVSDNFQLSSCDTIS
jgi:hypothetical protein